MLPSYQRTIPADVESLRDLHRDLVRFFATHGVPDKASHDAQLVCDELIGNAIRHGLGSFAGSDRRIDVSLRLADAIAIRIRDDLPLFDPTSVAPPERAASLAAARRDGRGLALVRRATIRFRWHAEAGRNVIDVEVPLDSP